MNMNHDDGNNDGNNDDNDDDNDDDDHESIQSQHPIAAAAAATAIKWTKGTPHPSNDRINHWSLNGFREPVFTGGLYAPSEIRALQTAIQNYCHTKNVTPAELCAEKHNKAVRGAWHEIAQCLPHRTVLSVYRRALRQFGEFTRGDWSDDEVAALYRLVELHGEKWKVIQDKLGRSAIHCRYKFYELHDQFPRGKWTAESLELLLRSVREVLRVPRDDMDVRQINQWTLDNRTKISWTIISHRVQRRRLDCYFKWRSMTKRSNRMALAVGLEPVPMARCTLKFDAKMDYYQWKAEQDPKWRSKYAQLCLLPLLQNRSSDIPDTQFRLDDALLGSIIQSKATRPSEVPWNAMRHTIPDGMSPRERFDHLVNTFAPDDAMDLPLWELAKLVKGALIRSASAGKGSTDREALRANVEKRAAADLGMSEVVVPTCSESNDDAAIRIPGIDVDAVRKKIKEIITGADHDELTVKGVRKMLETWLGVRLSKYHREIKALIIEAM